MHIKIKNLQIALLLIISFLLYLLLFTNSAFAFTWTTETRDEMIAIAGPFTNAPWKVITPNDSTYRPGSKYKSIKEMYGTAKKGTQYYGMAYSFGNADNITNFIYKINTKKLKPRNYDGTDKNYKPDLNIKTTTGIDCSAYVSIIWKIPRQGTYGLAGPTYSYGINANSITKGDIFNKAGAHTVLVFSGPFGYGKNQYKVYEASPWVHKVWLNPSWTKGTSYSPRRRYHVSDTTDATKPTVTPLTLKTGATVWGENYSVQMQVKDNINVSSQLGVPDSPKLVEWFLDSKKQSIDTRGSTWGVARNDLKEGNKRKFSWNLPISKLKTGKHTIVATATDWKGNKGSRKLYVRKKNHSRISGTNKWATMKKIVQNGWSSSSNSIILVSYKTFHDAVAATSLASLYDAPILFTDKDNLTQASADEIKRLKVKYVDIIGGASVISKEVEKDIKSINSKIEITRIAGDNAEDTAAIISDTMQELILKYFTYQTIFIVPKNKYSANGMAASTASARWWAPILYTNDDGYLPNETINEIKNNYKYNTAIYIAGHSDVIDNPKVENQLKSIIDEDSSTIWRIAINNYELSEYLSDAFFYYYEGEGGKVTKKAYIARGNISASGEPTMDALTGAALAGKYSNSAPVVLTPSKSARIFYFHGKTGDKTWGVDLSIVMLGGSSSTYSYYHYSEGNEYPAFSIISPKATIYSEPSTSSFSLGVVEEHQGYVPVPYIDKAKDSNDNFWHQIYFAGQKGWILENSIQNTIGERVIEILNDEQSVYNGPSEEFDEIGKSHKPERYVSNVDEDGWAGIFFDGTVGFIPPGSYKIAQLGTQDKEAPEIGFDIPKYVNKGEKIMTISADEPLSEEDGLNIDIKDSNGSPINFEIIKDDTPTESIDEEPEPDDEEVEETDDEEGEEGDAEIEEEEIATDSYEIEVPEEEIEEEQIEDREEDTTDEEDKEKELIHYRVKVLIDESTAQGDATINVRAKDMVGNTSEATKTFVVDLSVPETKVIPKIEPYLSEDGKLYTNKDNTFLIDPEDRYSGVENLFVSINNQGYQSFESTINVTFKDEGIYKIKYYATDKAGNKEEEKTYQVIIDNTPPESTISADLINEFFEVIPETLFTIHSTDKGKYPSGLSAIQYRIDEEAFKEYSPFMLKGKENGIHTITYRATDNVGNIEEEKSFVVNLKDALSVNVEDKTSIRRTAVWLNINEEEKPFVNREKLENLLENNNNYIYKITDSREEFITDLKSNLYTSYIILGNQLKLTDHEAAKLREQIFIGKTVISSLFTNIDEAPKPKTSSEYDEIFGVKHVGSLPSSNHSISLDENLNINGKAIKFETKNYTERIGSIDNTNYPAIIKNTFGKGKTYLFAFDLINNLNNQKIIEIMNTSLEETNPTVETLPLSPKVFKLNIKANVVLLTSQIDTIGSNAISYIPENYPYLINTTLDEQEIKLILRYPDENNSIFNTNTGYYVRGELISYKSFTFEETIEKTRFQITDEVTNEFDSYLSINDDSKIKLARDFLITLKESSTTLTNDQIVHELLKTIKDVVARDDLSSKTRENLSKLVVVYSSY